MVKQATSEKSFERGLDSVACFCVPKKKNAAGVGSSFVGDDTRMLKGQ